MTAPNNPEMSVVLAGPDGKVLDRFLPDSLMSQEELSLLLQQIAKPTNGWQRDDLASDVRASLSKADTALQSAPVLSVAGRQGAVTLVSGDVTDASTTGKAVLTAASAAAARSALGAGTSNLVLGTTAGTAAEATHTHAYGSLTGIPATFTPAAHQHEIGHVNNLADQLSALDSRIGSHTHPVASLTDATTVGRSVLTADTAAAARTALGAGTSSLSLGATATTAKPGDWTPSADNISDAGTAGRAVLRADSPADARSAIGATDLTLGSTSTTAKVGNWVPAWGDITSKPTTFAPASHTHEIAGVTGLQSALDSKAPATHSHPSSQINDATTLGQSILKAADAAAVRGLIGAGTGSSNLALGTTAGTAAAGNDARLSDQRVPTDGSVVSVKIADGAVGTAKLADTAVTNGKLGNGSVTDAKVSTTAAIALSKLATGKGLGRSNTTPADITTVVCTEAQYAAYDAAAKADPTFVFMVRP